jgi:hypothetical protein
MLKPGLSIRGAHVERLECTLLADEAFEGRVFRRWCGSQGRPGCRSAAVQQVPGGTGAGASGLRAGSSSCVSDRGWKPGWHGSICAET